MGADPPAGVEQSELRQVVGRLTGRPDPGRWSAEAIHVPVASSSAGVWRVSGDSWSAILKEVRHHSGGHTNWPSGLSEDHWGYWRRELLAYRSGLLDTLAGGLRAPACLLIAERGDDGAALWLEDVATGFGQSGTGWPVARYREAARHLGRAQGRFLTGRALPAERWLSRDWLRSYLAQRPVDPGILEDRHAWALLGAAGSGPARSSGPAEWSSRPPVSGLQAMVDARDRLLRALDALPETLSHLDLHPANLFDVDGDTVLIDWASVGIAPIGADAGNLVVDSVLDFHVDAAEIDALDRAVFGGYLDGLRDSGWSGPEELVRLGMAATLAAKYAWIAPAMLRAVRERRPEINRRPLAEALAWWVPAVGFLLGQAEEADRLIDLVSRERASDGGSEVL